MPALGADMEAGTLVAHRCEPGARIERGGIIAEVETDKGVIEVESYVSGVLERWLVPLGTKVPVGTPLAMLRDDAVAAEQASPPQAAQLEPVAQPRRELEPPAPSPSPQPQPSSQRETPAPSHPHAAATPSARKRARELGMDLDHLAPSGVLTAADVESVAAAQLGAQPQERTTVRDRERLRISPAAAKRARELGIEAGAFEAADHPIHLADVEALARARAAVPKPPPANDLTAGPRRAIAAAMARSKREIPHYYLETAVDLGAASSWLERHNAQASVSDRLLLGVLYLRAVALATQRMPDFNVRWSEVGPVRQPEVNLGVAISLRSGSLISPAIPSAQALSLMELMTAFQDLVARARSGRLRSSELSCGTITVTSLGERGVDGVFPIIHPPQTAIVGFGRSAARPWVVNGELCVRPVVQLTLAADHRITDGHVGSRYLALIEQLLQDPERL
jgi:pyruvate dehydrogenase E2 component (dihydrolipoamide acetyltransferase)